MRVLMVVLLAAFLAVGCGSGWDDATLEIAVSLPAADIEIDSAERIQVTAKAGRPDSGFPTFATVFQVYQPHGDDPVVVYDELRQIVESQGWEIEALDEDGGWSTAVREFQGRYFYVYVGYAPSKGTVTLRLDEWNRTNPLP